MGKKSKIQDELNKFESVLESLEKYPDFESLFMPQDIEAMKKAVENETSVPVDCALRLRVAAVRLSAKITQTHKKKVSKRAKIVQENSANENFTNRPFKISELEDLEIDSDLSQIKPTDDKLAKKLRKKIQNTNKRVEELENQLKALKSNHESEIEKLKDNHLHALSLKNQKIAEIETETSKLKLEKLNLEAKNNELESKAKQQNFSAMQSKYDYLRKDFRKLQSKNQILIGKNNFLNLSMASPTLRKLSKLMFQLCRKMLNFTQLKLQRISLRRNERMTLKNLLG